MPKKEQPEARTLHFIGPLTANPMQIIFSFCDGKQLFSLKRLNAGSYDIIFTTPALQEIMRLYTLTKIPNSPASSKLQRDHLASNIVRDAIQRGLRTVEQALNHSKSYPADTENSKFVLFETIGQNEVRYYYPIHHDLIRLGLAEPDLFPDDLKFSICIHTQHKDLILQYVNTLKITEPDSRITLIKQYCRDIYPLSPFQAQGVLLGLSIPFVKQYPANTLTPTLLETLKKEADDNKNAHFNLEAACKKLIETAKQKLPETPPRKQPILMSSSKKPHTPPSQPSSTSGTSSPIKPTRLHFNG